MSISPVKERTTTVFAVVLTTDAASWGWFLPRFSEANLVRAVDRASPVVRKKIDERKVRMERAPMLASVRALVFATTM